jgi:hypothetical protein
VSEAEASGARRDGVAVPVSGARSEQPAQAGAGDEDTAEARPTLLDQMGGPMGMVDSGLPVVVFVIVNLLAGLTAGIVAALSAGVLIAILRLVRRKPVTQALGGLVAVGVAAYIAHRVGSARGYFLFGIWTYLLYGGVMLASVLVRWPLIGVAWEGLNGRGPGWRRDRHLLHRYDAATLVWVAVFAARYAVQQWLYGADQVGWLAFARLAMGYPLFIVAIVVTVLIVGTASGMRLPALLRRSRESPDSQA